MLRALLRRANRKRRRNTITCRKANISKVREGYINAAFKLREVERAAATKIQCLKRRLDAEAEVNKRRNRLYAAKEIQKVWRGILGRAIAHELKMQLVRVVSTKYQMQVLKTRCTVLSTFGQWEELRDPSTNSIFFYFTPTGDSQWEPPTGKELGCVSDYHCTFEDCTMVFSSLLSLEHHRKKQHKWQCAACFRMNSVSEFPRCGGCGNEKGAGGKHLNLEYENKWETRLYVRNPEHSKSSNQSLARNSLTDLRPQSGVDREFIELRKKVLSEMKKYSLAEHEVICGEVEKEWPDQQAQRGPMTDHAYVRKVRKNRDVERKKALIGKEITQKLSFSETFSNEVAHASLGKSTMNEILGWTEGRPVTPLVASRLCGIPLHEWFKRNQKEQDRKTLKKLPSITLDKFNSHDDVTPSSIRGESVEGRSKSLEKVNNPSFCSGKKAKRFEHIKSITGNILTAFEENVDKKETENPALKPCVEKGALKIYQPLVRNGQGTRIFSGGSLYTGNLKFSVMEGHGTMKYHNGDVYSGLWKRGYRCGHGKFCSIDGKVYKGQWKDGARHGYGILSHPNGEIYTGQWKHGKMCGCGTLRSANGDVYEGQWLNGKYHGLGKFTKENGHFFIGHCINGKANGNGIIHYTSGESYRGMWKEDERHGRGVGLSPDGSKYVGDWKRGKYDGRGKIILPNGETFSGHWFMGKRHGYGKAVFHNKDTFIGMWSSDRVSGLGIMHYFTSGNVYDGNFDKGMRNGMGTIKCNDGGTFRGFFKDGKIHGRGIFRYSNGDIYQGQFQGGRKHGKGVFQWANGNIYKGIFRDDKLDGLGEMRYSVGHSYFGKWKNGKKHGYGKLSYSNGNSYEGLWALDLRHGNGKFMWNSLSKNKVEFYDGEWINDRREGKGLYHYKNGSTYEGSWVNGVRHGQGVFQFADGAFYNGLFKNNFREGHGIFQSVKGTQYNGTWKNGYMHGLGILSKSRGEMYEGEFRFGKKHGDGKIIFQNGSIFVGSWKGGRKHGKGQYLYQARKNYLNRIKSGVTSKSVLRISVFGQ